MFGVIRGIKLIHHTGGTKIEDDPSLPYKLEVDLRPPEFMQLTFILLYGQSEEIILRGKTRKAIDKFVKLNEIETHPRLRKLIITGPNGIEHKIEK